MKRVKFYSVNDLSIAFYLPRCADVLQSFDGGRTYDINDIIEFYNIDQLVSAYDNSKKWNIKELNKFEQKSKLLKKVIGVFINAINDNNFVSISKQVDMLYKIDFFSILEEYKGFKSISKEVFSKILQCDDVVIRYVLYRSQIVKYFDNEIRRYMLQVPSSAILLLEKYEIIPHTGTPQIYLPVSLSIEDKENILSQYIKEATSDLNEIRLIANLNNSGCLRISDKTRLAARKKAKEIQDEIFSANDGLPTEIEIAFTDKQEELVINHSNGRNFNFSYSGKWLRENIHTSILITNFIYMFHYIDIQARFQFVSKKSYSGTLEKHLGLNSKNAYFTSIFFQQMDALTTLQIKAYYTELMNIGIDLESIFKHYFEEYVPVEFNDYGFRYNTSGLGTSFLVKCRNVFPEIEAVLKQFKLLVENKEIDHELLQISSNPIDFDKIPSLLTKKYLYGKGSNFERISYFFFSDQCMLAYVKRLGDKQYENFYELLLAESVYVHDFHNHNQADIDWLINNQFLSIDENKKLNIKNKNQIDILKDLFYNEVISYWHYPQKLQSCVDQMLLDELITSENSLFSKLESDYLDYYLNKSKFNNGFDLRNKYLHGTQSSGSDEDVHRHNFFIALKLLALITLKINDELCLFSDLVEIHVGEIENE